MDLFTIARFHARAGRENEVEAAIREVSVPTRAEPGCLSYQVYRSTRDGALSSSIRAGRTKPPSIFTLTCRTRCTSSHASSR